MQNNTLFKWSLCSQSCVSCVLHFHTLQPFIHRARRIVHDMIMHASCVIGRGQSHRYAHNVCMVHKKFLIFSHFIRQVQWMHMNVVMVTLVERHVDNLSSRKLHTDWHTWQKITGNHLQGKYKTYDRQQAIHTPLSERLGPLTREACHVAWVRGI